MPTACHGAMSELHDLPALEQAAAVRSGEASPTSSWSSTTSIASAGSTRRRRVRHLTADQARAQATEADAGCAPTATSCRRCTAYPIAIKDLNLTAGSPHDARPAVFDDFVPAVDDHVVEQAARGRHDQPRQDQHA